MWIGKPVTLFTVWTDFQGQSVEAIRVRPAAAPQPQYQPAPPPMQAQQPPRFDNPPAHTEAPPSFTASDDIPF
jgi:hypothetical protein